MAETAATNKDVKMSIKKQIILLLSLVVAINVAWAGEYRDFGHTMNLRNADNKTYHFGFILGFNTMDFNIDESGLKAADDGKVWFADVNSISTGFTVGMISDLRLGEYFNLRFNPVLLFNDRKVTFVAADGTPAPEDITVKSTMIDFPLLVKARAQRMGNFRPYLLAGPAVTLDLGRSRDADLLLKALDYGVEFGFGCDVYLPYFKLAPEIKMFYGFGDMLDTDRPELEGTRNIKWQNAIEKLTSRLFTLTFNFE